MTVRRHDSSSNSSSNQELATLKQIRRFLIKNMGRVKARRVTPERTEMRKRMDEALLAFRLARKAALEVEAAGGDGSWLRAVRQSVGLPVAVVARRLGVGKYEVFRLEKAERESRIVLATLRKAAEALGCEVVYALTPRKGSLEDLAALERAERERVREKAKELREKREREIEKCIGFEEAVWRMLRREFRKKGYRLR